MRNIFITTIGLIIISNSVSGQIIDSISIKPYQDVDSIQFWHTKELRNLNQYYFVKGYFEYCSCDYHRFLKERNYKGKEKKIIYEGMIENGFRQGVWIYWHDVKDCCDEIQLYSDSSITYDQGKRIKKIDRFATYFYYGSDSLIINPFYDKKEVIKNKIVCQKGFCKIIVNDKYTLNDFAIENLDREIEKIQSGVYNFDSRKIIEKATKR
jgi:hypothetical protein